jgi:hypothetical protein
VDQAGIHGHTRVACHADGRGVHQPIGLPDASGDIIRPGHRQLAVRKVRGQPGGEGFGLCRFNVGDDQVPGSRAEEPEGHRCTGTPRTDLHHRVGHGRRESGPEAADEAPVVGVVAHRLAVVESDGVDGTEDQGIWGELIQAVLHQLLAWVGDVKAVVSEISCASDQRRGLPGLLPDGIQIDDTIRVREAQPAGFRLMQARGE